jgi:hypothetical protein
MSRDLARTPGRGLERRADRRADLQLSRELRSAQLPAKRAAARLQAAAYAAHVGLSNTEVLTALEVQAIQRQGAVMDARAKAIVDAYAGLAATELARLALEE